MEFDLRPAFAGVLAYVALFSSFGVLWALFGRARKRLWLWLAAAALVVALFVGIPWIAPPVLGAGRLAPLAGVLFVAAGAAFAFVALRARRSLVQAEDARPIAAADAMARLAAGDAAPVAVEGAIEGDPPVYGPVSGRPCIGYRVELFRLTGRGEELVGLEEASCDRVVLADGTARLAVSVDPAALRVSGAPVTEATAVGVPGAPGAPARLARVVQLDRSAGGGGGRYRAVERSVPSGARMAAVGRMVRRGGEPVLVPALAAAVSLRFGAPSDVVRATRRVMIACTVLAAVSVASGMALLAVRTPPPVEAKP